MAESDFDHRVAAVRRFNRFYTRQIGLLQESYLKSQFSLSQVRVLYELVKRSGALTAETVARLYGVPRERLTAFVEYDPALAIKFTIRRERPSGSPGERDVFGAQQYAPLFDLPIPVGS